MSPDASPRVAPTATIVGDVRLAGHVSVWHGAVLRGDMDFIEVGERSNVQDNCVVHTDAGFPVRIGKGVVVGHGAIVHGATVHDDVTVGMGAILTNGVVVGRGSYVGAGAVLPEGMEVPERTVVLGVPAKVRREAREEDVQRTRSGAAHYVELAAGSLPQWRHPRGAA